MSDAIFLALIPLIGYSLLFSYQWGYFNVFDIPFQFIELSIEQVFVVTAGLITLFFVVIYLLMTLTTFMNPQKLPIEIRRKIQRNLPVSIFLIVCAFVFFRFDKFRLLFFIALLIMFITDFIIPLILYKFKKNYLLKLEKNDLERREADSYFVTLVDSFISTAGNDIARFTIYYLLTIVIVSLMGRGAALNKSEFYVANTDPETVVLYMTKDKVILADFDRDFRIIGDSFYVIEINKHPEIKFTYETVGPFNLPYDSTSTFLDLPTAMPTFFSTQSYLPTTSITPTP